MNNTLLVGLMIAGGVGIFWAINRSGRQASASQNVTVSLPKQGPMEKIFGGIGDFIDSV